MEDMLTVRVPLTDKRRADLHGRYLFCTPISEAEAVVFGEGVEALPELLASAKAGLAQLGAGPELAEKLDTVARIAAVIREAHHRGFFAGASGAPETGRVQ